MTLHEKLKIELGGWANSHEGELCLKLAEYMQKTPNEQLELLTFRTIAFILKESDAFDAEVFSVVNICLNESVDFLEKHFLFIEDEIEEQLSSQDVIEAHRDGWLVHPRHGTELSDYEDYIVPYFTPSAKFKRMKAQMRDE